MAPIPCVFFATDTSFLSAELRSFVARGHGVTLVCHPETLLGSLQGAAPELAVLDTGALLGTGLGTLAALKAVVARSGVRVLLLSEYSGSLTACAAAAVGARAAFRPGEPCFAEAAESLCGPGHVSERAVAA